MLAADQRDDDMRQLAAYYAGLPAPRTQPSAAGQASIGLGESLRSKARQSMAFRLARHVTAIPAQPTRFSPVSMQPIRRDSCVQRTGHGPSTDAAVIMAPIAAQLSDAEIGAVAAYFATFPPEPREAYLP